MDYTISTNEISEHQDCIDGYKWRSVVCDILEHLRQERKYEGKEVTNIENLEEFIYDNMDSYHLTKDE
jgi:hypothetical protein